MISARRFFVSSILGPKLIHSGWQRFSVSSLILREAEISRGGVDDLIRERGMPRL